MKTKNQLSQENYGKNYNDLPDDGAEQDYIMAIYEAAKRGVSCDCHLKELVTGPVPHCCPACDGDYSSFLAFHNCD